VSQFDYNLAFSRNIGLVTKEEQAALKTKKIAIAGLGGVGGFLLLTMVRMGVEYFHIADMDIFEIQNFNRQVGAKMSTIGKEKIEVLIAEAKDINPDVKITGFAQGVKEENIQAFIQGIDLYIDGLDFFVLDIRQKLFNAFLNQKTPCITAGPIGLSFALLTFMPDKMGFDAYFAFERAKNDFDKALLFLMGLTPKFLHRDHIIDPTSINLQEKRGPSNILACNGCTAAIGAEALKILLGRGKIYAAPYAQQYDFYNCKFKRVNNRKGNYSLMNKFKFNLLKKRLKLM
jgi:molybdopterin/thiamine biosynthesis adenylyltransferase